MKEVSAEVLRDTSFVITIRMPAAAVWKQDPTQVAFTVSNCMKSWIESSIVSNTSPIVSVSQLKFVDEVREKAIAFELLKASGHITKRKAEEALRIARGLS